MLAEVESQKTEDFNEGFLGYVDTYYYLSKIIPNDKVILDLGCGYAAQAYFFQAHKKYIGVDTNGAKKFTFPNTEMYDMSIEEFMNKHVLNPEEVFAICNYVPGEHKQKQKIFQMFPNHFNYNWIT